MYVPVHTCVSVHMCEHACARVCTRKCVNMGVHVWECTRVSLCACKCMCVMCVGVLRVSAYMNTRVYVCRLACMWYIYEYVYMCVPV